MSTFNFFLYDTDPMNNNYYLQRSNFSNYEYYKIISF